MNINIINIERLVLRVLIPGGKGAYFTFKGRNIFSQRIGVFLDSLKPVQKRVKARKRAARTPRIAFFKLFGYVFKLRFKRIYRLVKIRNHFPELVVSVCIGVGAYNHNHAAVNRIEPVNKVIQSARNFRKRAGGHFKRQRVLLPFFKIKVIRFFFAKLLYVPIA